MQLAMLQESFVNADIIWQNGMVTWVLADDDGPKFNFSIVNKVLPNDVFSNLVSSMFRL